MRTWQGQTEDPGGVGDGARSGAEPFVESSEVGARRHQGLQVLAPASADHQHPDDHRSRDKREQERTGAWEN
jgi:hypothetical protein